jgi:predicted transcriptional regulator
MGKHLFRNHEDMRIIFEVYAECGGMNETARLTGIPQTTVKRYLSRYKTLANFDTEHLKPPKFSTLQDLKDPIVSAQEIHFHYAYILGIYLGDGHISKSKSHSSERIMIFLDKKYPQIINRCQESLKTIFPSHNVSVINRPTWVYVSCFSEELPLFFPQHGAGKKHERPIILEAWQQRIVDLFPLEFFRGLYHSDGSRSRNVVNGKNYSRYFFCNKSEDIQRLYITAVEKLGLQWTQTNNINFAISRREDVAWLDEHVGAKA